MLEVYSPEIFLQVIGDIYAHKWAFKKNKAYKSIIKQLEQFWNIECLNNLFEKSIIKGLKRKCVLEECILASAIYSVYIVSIRYLQKANSEDYEQ